ncbi:hypothetical protein [Arthrobacter sp. MDT1-65]
MSSARLFFKLHNGFPEHHKTIELSDKAFRQLIEAWCYCSRNLNDGKLTNAQFSRLFSAKTRKELITAGFVVAAGTGYEMHDYLEHQESAEDVEIRRNKRIAAGKLGGKAKAENLASASHDAKQTPSKPLADIDVDRDIDKTNPKTSSSDADASDQEAPGFSPEVESLCQHLAAHITRNGNKPGTIGTRWKQAADRLIRIDGYTPDQIRQVIDWSQADEFWQGNILSMSKLREKFDTLKTRMINERQRGQNVVHLDHSARGLAKGAALLAKLDAQNPTQFQLEA